MRAWRNELEHFICSAISLARFEVALLMFTFGRIKAGGFFSFFFSQPLTAFHIISKN